jgi:hypothetical protein
MGKTHFKVGRLAYIILNFSAQNQSSLDTWCKKNSKKIKFPKIMALENSGNGCKCPLRPLGVEAHSLLYCMVHWWVLVHLVYWLGPCKWCIMFCGTCLPQDT